MRAPGQKQYRHLITSIHPVSSATSASSSQASQCICILRVVHIVSLCGENVTNGNGARSPYPPIRLLVYTTYCAYTVYRFPRHRANLFMLVFIRHTFQIKLSTDLPLISCCSLLWLRVVQGLLATINYSRMYMVSIWLYIGYNSCYHSSAKQFRWRNIYLAYELIEVFAKASPL